MKNNWYKILNVLEEASLDEVRDAYRKMILISHPDKGGNSNDFRKVQEAYQYYLTNNCGSNEMDYVDSRLTTRLELVYDKILMYIVDCRLQGLNMNVQIFINCLKIKGIPRNGANTERMKDIIFIGISNDKIIKCLKLLNLSINGTRKELINNFLYSEPKKTLQLYSN